MIIYTRPTRSWMWRSSKAESRPQQRFWKSWQISEVDLQAPSSALHGSIRWSPTLVAFSEVDASRIGHPPDRSANPNGALPIGGLRTRSTSDPNPRSRVLARLICQTGLGESGALLSRRDRRSRFVRRRLGPRYPGRWMRQWRAQAPDSWPNQSSPFRAYRMA